MKKTIILIFIIFLCFSSFLLTGCTKKTTISTKASTEKKPTYTKSEKIVDESFKAKKLNEVNNENYSIVSDIVNGKYLLKQGTSEYKIIIPDVISNQEGSAADELVYFLKLSTGYTFKCISEKDLKENDKYISIGYTDKLKSESLDVGLDSLGRSGFIIKTVGENIYIIGENKPSSLGVIYGVYQMLDILIDYKCYTEDEIKYVERTYLELVNFDIRYVPQIEARSINYGSIIVDPTYRQRRRVLERFGSTDWAINGHSMLLIMPLTKYFETHPEWYSQTKTELCMSNPEMRKEFIKNVIEYIDDFPDSIYLSVTMMDDNDYCQCEECNKCYQKYGGEFNGGVAGLQIDFINEVADAVKEYVDTNYPGRDMTLVTYAYHQTFVPPVIYNSETEKYEAVSEDVIPHDNVSVMFCPISQDYYHDIDDLKNEAISKSYIGWTSITDNVSVYEYLTNFNWYEINFYNFNSIKDDIEFYAKKHVLYYFGQTSGATSTPCFEELRIYTESELLWNPTLDYQKLVDDFFLNYFKDAKDGMYKYFSDLRTWYEGLYEKGVNVGNIYLNLMKAEYWPLQVLKSFLSDIDEAFESIEYLKDENIDLYNKLWNRINKEKLSVLYLICSLYKAYYSADEYKQMVDDLEYYGGLYSISKEGESAGSYTDMINRLRGN